MASRHANPAKNRRVMRAKTSPSVSPIFIVFGMSASFSMQRLKLGSENTVVEEKPAQHCPKQVFEFLVTLLKEIHLPLASV